MTFRRALACLAAFVAVASAALWIAAAPAAAQTAKRGADPRVEAYLKARAAFETQLDAYWQEIAAKRRARLAKRRNKSEIGPADYVLAQPPEYSGPPRPPSAPKSVPDLPSAPKREVPVVADFLKAAAEHYGFAPDRPESEAEFKRAYARAAAGAGLTRDQVVRVYGFETGGNGTHDAQSGLSPRRPGAKAISQALGYNQLLSTNTVGLLADFGDNYVKHLMSRAGEMAGPERERAQRRIAALHKMIAASRKLPPVWSEHDKFAWTPPGFGLHAVLLDRDVGPLLQAQKLANSVRFAKLRGHKDALTGAELQMMNLTGDGNGIDIVTMPEALRRKVPTANFFQQGGYERNPVAQRHNTVAALLAATDAKMDQTAKAPGARELAAMFPD